MLKRTVNHVVLGSNQAQHGRSQRVIDSNNNTVHDSTTASDLPWLRVIAQPR